MKTKIVLLMVLISSLQLAWGKSTEQFHKRFKFVKENDQIVSVLDNSIAAGFGIRPYIEYIKNRLSREQQLINSSLDYEGSIRELFQDDEEFLNGNNKNIDYLVNSLKELPKIEIEKVFNNPKFNEVINAYEKKLGDIVNRLDPRVIARPQEPTFFYKKKQTYQILLWGLNFAKKKLSSIPMLNTASYIMVEVEKMVRTRREFHQNMFLHYLHTFPEEELGLTPMQANQIFSSIYESRIPWFAFWESKLAVQNWVGYGASSFYKGVRVANNRLREFSGMYSRRGTRMTYSFQEVELNGENVVVNLFDNEGMFHKTPAIAFSNTEPKKIARKRLLLQLAGLGVSFLPISQFFKDTVSNGLKSYYEKQMITEGALYGYFESIQDEVAMEQVAYQYLNPFEKL